MPPSLVFIFVVFVVTRTVYPVSHVLPMVCLVVCLVLCHVLCVPCFQNLAANPLDGFRYQQQNVGLAKTLGEMYNHRLVDSTTLFDVLYMVLDQGHIVPLGSLPPMPPPPPTPATVPSQAGGASLDSLESLTEEQAGMVAMLASMGVSDEGEGEGEGGGGGAPCV